MLMTYRDLTSLLNYAYISQQGQVPYNLFQFKCVQTVTTSCPISRHIVGKSPFWSFPAFHYFASRSRRIQNYYHVSRYHTLCLLLVTELQCQRRCRCLASARLSPPPRAPLRAPSRSLRRRAPAAPRPSAGGPFRPLIAPWRRRAHDINEYRFRSLEEAVRAGASGPPSGKFKKLKEHLVQSEALRSGPRV